MRLFRQEQPAMWTGVGLPVPDPGPRPTLLRALVSFDLGNDSNFIL